MDTYLTGSGSAGKRVREEGVSDITAAPKRVKLDAAGVEEPRRCARPILLCLNGWDC